MKYFVIGSRFAAGFVIAVFCLYFCGCGGGLLETAYTVTPPDLPAAWKGFGAASWRIEWVGQEGEKESRIVNPGETAAISPIREWASPVLARPFFPQKGIAAGVMKPAGGIFPYDAAGNRMRLTWQGGVDASFYWELAEASAEGTDAAALRRPYYFDWPRFRALFSGSSVKEALREDPWLADWKTIAGKTVRSGFDYRRLVPETRLDREIPVGSGPWTGSSPFAPPLFFDGPPVFPLRSAVDVWYSDAGTLKCSTEGWVFYPH
jgi:hypothetical protein